MMNETISYLKAYGIDKRQTNLLYKRLQSGRYIVAYIKYDIDVFLCSWLPQDQEHTNSDCVIEEILGFRCDDTIKRQKFMEMLNK